MEDIEVSAKISFEAEVTEKVFDSGQYTAWMYSEDESEGIKWGNGDVTLLLVRRETSDVNFKDYRKHFSSSDRNILDIPDEILQQIILHLDARERVPLGNSCERFYDLVFKDQILLRDLDFSKNAHLASESDILSYFKDQSTWKHILRINLSSVKCIEPGPKLNQFIGRASTLVDINVHGFQFNDIQQLGSFLEGLLSLKRLSFDWPNTTEKDTADCEMILEQPFSQLTFLSIKTLRVPWSTEFIRSLQLCQFLEELIIVKYWIQDSPPAHIWNIRRKQLQNLTVISYDGPYSREFKEHMITLLPNPKKWTEFRVTSNSSSDPKGFYLEKDIKVCEELLKRKVMQSPSNHGRDHLNIGSVLFLDHLLKEVIKMTHEDVPEEFCCLSTLKESQQYLLKMEEAKQLLKDPQYQISYLCIRHYIKPDCDVHLVATAFPNLTELVLSTVMRNDSPSTITVHPERRLKRRGVAIPKEEYDLHNIDRYSSFKMLTENMPRLRHVTLRVQQRSDGEWDLLTLDLIPGWKNLETLHLVFYSNIEHLLYIKEITATNLNKNVILSTKQLLHRCTKLIAFLCEIGCKFESDYNTLSSALQGLNIELNRPNLQIQVVHPRNWCYSNGSFLDTPATARDKFDVDKFFGFTQKTSVYGINRW